MAFPLAAVLDIGSKIIDRVFPDKEKAAEAKLKLLELQQSGELAQLTAETDIAKGQIEVNKVEAASSNLFVSGWRPAVGWVAAIALFTYYVPYCLVATGIWAYQVVHQGSLVPRPDLGITDLLGLVGGMLGLATLRTVEKRSGVA